MKRALETTTDDAGEKRARPAMPVMPVMGASVTPSTVPVSRVLHVRSLPSMTTEQDVAMLVAPFGSVERVVVLTQKNQALVQLATVDSAVACITYFSTAAAQLRGRQVYLQFSSHQDLNSTVAVHGSTFRVVCVVCLQIALSCVRAFVVVGRGK